MADEDEIPTPTQAELNAINRAVYGIADEDPEKSDLKEGDEPIAKASYKTRQVKAD